MTSTEKSPEAPAEEAVEEKQERLSLRRSAMDFLARREHSRYELYNKLSKKYPDSDPALLQQILDKLQEDRLLSDQRFAEAYLRYRKDKGYGPAYIRHHLQACRVAPEIIEQEVLFHDPDWDEILLNLLRKKLGSSSIPERGSKQMLKLQRFVMSRGFGIAQLEKALASPGLLEGLWMQGKAR